jgi:FMN hydrolase / 5-amino-6-(5-phospho-D-ribitylamino)uracil phosphatase
MITARNSILAVTFDGDGTLWDVLTAAREALSSVAEIINGEQSSDQSTVTVAELEQARLNTERNYPHWQMAKLRQQSFRDVLSAHDIENINADKLWDSFLEARRAHTRLYDDAIPTLQELRSRAIKTCLLSNGNTLPEHVGLAGFFDYVQVAEYAGVRKPDSEAFALAAKSLGCAPESILHVGDDVRDDYEAAQKCGFYAALLCRSGPHSVGIDTLAYVPGLIDQISHQQ